MEILLDFFLNFSYYITLFFIPVAFYALFLKNPGKFSTNKDWFYATKFIFARAAIKKYQQKCKITLDEISKKKLENPKKICSDISSDSHFIYGSDQKGNNLSLRLTIRSGLIAEVFICLRVSTGAIYTFPGKTTKLYSISSWRWKTKDLNVEILEPFKKIRVTYNGLLSNANHDVEHVQFNFIWTAAGAPTFFPQDAPTGLLAEALARETWRDGDWIGLLGDERGYEQFGALRGSIRGDSFADDLTLNLPSCRTRFWGMSEKLALERSVHLFVAGKDGTLINLWVKALRRGCSQLKYGNVIMCNGQIVPIADSDVMIGCLGQNGSPPSMFTVHFKVKGRIYKTVFHVNLRKGVQVRNEESRGYDLSNIPAECDLDTVQARSLVEFWYKRQGTTITLPPPLLVENKTQRIPNCYVSTFTDEESRLVRLSGGKGCSLALLASLDVDDLFTVPEGFIVTVAAFTKQLDVNFNMKKAVAILDDICCGRIKGDLEQACTETVKTFTNEKMAPEIADAILTALRNVKNDRWAVRSSAVGEDSEELSAAGQNETYLGCTSGDDVIKSISCCWASLFTYQSVRYRHQHGLPVQSEMAVVVQKMIPADCAGVLFTCHPSTGNPAQIVITSNHGLGESVVSGRSEPDTIILERTFDNDLTIKSKSLGSKQKIIKMADEGVEEAEGMEGFSITDNQALDLGKVGVFLEEKFGGARDIEWAYYQGRLYLLQARPVTTLNSWTDSELLHEFDVATLTDDVVYTVANAGEVFPGAICVLSLSTVVKTINGALQRNIYGREDEYVLNCLSSFQHHMFIDVINSLHPKESETIKLSSKIIDLALIGHPIIDDTIHSISIHRFGVVTPWGILKNLIEMTKSAWQNEENVRKIKSVVLNFKFRIDNDRDTVKDVFVKIDSLLHKMVDVFQLHCFTTRTSVTYQIVAMTILVENSEDFTTDHYSDVATLLSSCDEVVSAEIPAILARIAQIVIQNGHSENFGKVEPKLGQLWLKTNCPEASEVFDKFLQDHGHRALGELDLYKRTWAMNPEEIIKMIQANCNIKASKQEKTTKSIDDVIKSLTSPKRSATRKILKFLLKKSRRAVGAREQTKSESVKFVDKVRTAYRFLGRKMALAGLIPDQDLIFHLSHYEISLVIDRDESSPILITKALKRQRLYPKWDRLKFPEINYGIPRPQSNDFVARTGTGKIKCEGTPVCAGSIEARACVIADLSEIDQLEDGDVLITYCTDIGWSPYFPMLAGIVTELGGLVSHGAVIAREYGLPCIVGVRDAMKTFKTGDVVLLSGKSGTIELL